MKTKLIPKDIDLYVGIDNGVSGTVGIIGEGYSEFFKTPTIFGQDYVKRSQNVTRNDHGVLKFFLERCALRAKRMFVLIERPMINPRMFKASISATRCMESQLIILDYLAEEHYVVHQFCDSKEWQKTQLPKGTTGKDLKLRSMQVGCRLYPEHSLLMTKHKDADGILIARHCKLLFGEGGEV